MCSLKCVFLRLRNSGTYLDLPFFQITSRLDPIDILQLSRVSKQFRSTFASRGSRHIWVAARCSSDVQSRCHSSDYLFQEKYTRHARLSARLAYCCCRDPLERTHMVSKDLTEPQFASLMFEHNCQASLVIQV